MIREPHSQFVRREAELSTVGRLLTESRLVTLTGVGGVGKTRLAIRAANEHALRTGAMVWFVGFDSVKDAVHLPVVLLNALVTRDQSSRDPLDVVVEFVQNEDALLLLDNCEHLIDAAANLVSDLLDRLPAIRILATSRRPLELQGERAYPVPPLGVDPSSDGASDAVALLIRRAQEANPGFQLLPGELPIAETLCRSLDGLPLAIELAASRLRALSIADLAERASSRFTLLDHGPRNAVERQRTLRAVVDWSYELCTDREQLAWTALSVFTSRFDLGAAMAVCRVLGIEESEAIDALDGLAAQSLVEVTPDRSRYRMLETIRTYGRERLDSSGQAAALRRAHFAHYRQLVHESRINWYGPGQAAALGRLREDHAEFVAAFATAESGTVDTDAALDLASDLRFHWAAGGYLREGRSTLDRLLEASDASAPHRAPALIVAAWLSLLQGDLDAAEFRLAAAEDLIDSLRQATAVEDSIELARWRGTHALFSGDLPSAVKFFAQSIRIADHAGVESLGLLSRFQLTTVLALGKAPDATAPAAEALKITTGLRESWMRSHSLWSLALAHLVAGDLDRADLLGREAIAIEQNFNDGIGTCLMLEVLAWTSAAQRSTEHASALLGAASAQWRRIGSRIYAFGPGLASMHDDAERGLRSSLGSRSFERLQAIGARLDLHGAIELALAAGERRDATLSARELDVAYGIHRGLSNREIAGELVLSTRTIDTHVQRILAKLGFTSRTQVAAWVEARGFRDMS